MGIGRDNLGFRWCISDHCRNTAAVIGAGVNPEKTQQTRHSRSGTPAVPNPGIPQTLKAAVTQTIPEHCSLSLPSRNPSVTRWAGPDQQSPNPERPADYPTDRTRRSPGRWQWPSPARNPRFNPACHDQGGLVSTIGALPPGGA